MTTTLASSLANAFAVASPNPEAPPNIIATLSYSFIVCLLFLNIVNY
ncbi:secreted protein [marine sediment metagenome]|uniref:Secreted protein n=1 Tax=marine sediment metagenome TaxID=412755 RepID=A0A1B6NRU7_9ZZZZ